MFSRKLFIFVAVALFLAISFTVITMSSRDALQVSSAQRFFISITSPVQKAVAGVFSSVNNIWTTYFMAVLAVEENALLKAQLSETVELKNRYRELELENRRLRKFVNFTQSVPEQYVAAQIIAWDPSPWFKTIVIDKGAASGLAKGNPVLVSEGIVGQIVEVSRRSARVLLITDRNSAVDALIQNSRVRGVVKGNNENFCRFVYTLRKDEVIPGEIIISSGLDQVFPKGLIIGKVSDVTKLPSQLFQDIIIETSVDFDKIEEVLVLKNTQ